MLEKYKQQLKDAYHKHQSPTDKKVSYQYLVEALVNHALSKGDRNPMLQYQFTYRVYLFDVIHKEICDMVMYKGINRPVYFCNPEFIEFWYAMKIKPSAYHDDIAFLHFKQNLISHPYLGGENGFFALQEADAGILMFDINREMNDLQLKVMRTELARKQAVEREQTPGERR